jgi:hypothetical protein
MRYQRRSTLVPQTVLAAADNVIALRAQRVDMKSFTPN